MATVPVGGLLRQLTIAGVATATITVGAGQRAVLEKLMVGKTLGSPTAIRISSPSASALIQAKTVSNEFIKDAEQVVPVVGDVGDDIVVTLIGGISPTATFFLQYTLHGS